MILAIDPSVANTAACFGDAEWYEVKHFPSKKPVKEVRQRLARYEDTVKELLAWLDEYDETIDHCVIEGYKMAGPKKAYEDNLAEYGAILRWHLADVVQGDIIEIPPTSLKLFVTAKGMCDKWKMAACVNSKWKVMLQNDNEYDAYGLFELGKVIYGLTEPKFDYEAEAAHKAIGGKPFPVTGRLTQTVGDPIAAPF